MVAKKRAKHNRKKPAKTISKRKVQPSMLAIHETNYLPFFIAIFGCILLSLLFFADADITGYAVKDAAYNPVYCLKEGRDGLFYKVSDKKQCCFLIDNAGVCKAENTNQEYYNQGEVEGVFEAKYSCGINRKILLRNIVKTYCGLQI